mmetsp:Transcript_70927/g.188595  ORF Transcript_70927/g.188595 Transcript_70927/m.188595 type:complete len:403 (+) Transcript_70927:249-1457(+)
MPPAASAEVLQLAGARARAELVVLAEHVLAGRLGGHTAEHDAVQQGVAAQAVVAMDAAGNLAGGVQARDGLAGLGGDDCGVGVDLEAAHAVVDDRRDDRDVEGLGLHLVGGEDVVVELLAAAGLAAGLVPRLARRVGRVGAAIRVLLGLRCRLVVRGVGVLEDLDVDAHVLGEGRAGLVEVHDAAAVVVLAVPRDLVRRRLVEDEAEGRLALPHLARDVVAAAELVGEALAVGVEHEAAHSAQGLGGQELDLGIGVVGLHEAGGVHLNPLEVDALAANGLTHLDAVAGAVLAVGGGQVHEVRAVLRQEGLLGEVGTEAAARQDHGAVLLGVHAALLINEPHDGSSVHQELVGARLGDDARPVGLLGDLLEHLDQGVGDGHAGEALLATMSTRHRVTTQPSNK